MVSGSDDFRVYIWKIPSGEPRQGRLEIHQLTDKMAAFVPTQRGRTTIFPPWAVVVPVRFCPIWSCPGIAPSSTKSDTHPLTTSCAPLAWRKSSRWVKFNRFPPTLRSLTPCVPFVWERKRLWWSSEGQFVDGVYFLKRAVFSELFSSTSG